MTLNWRMKMKIKSTPSILSLALTASLLGSAAWSTDSHACAADSPYIGSICYMATNYCPEGYLIADGSAVAVSNYQALYALIGTVYGGSGQTFNLPDLRGRAVIGWGAATPQTSTVPFGAKRGAESVTLSASQVPLQPHTHPASFASGSSAPQASGNVSLPVAVAVPSQNISVSGNVKIANSSASGQQTVSANAVLAKGGSPANIYAPASSVTADTNIGPSQTFNGATAAATVNTTAAGPVSLPVSGGSITVGATGAAATASVSLISPQQALTACIAVSGIYPVRP